MTGFRRSAAQGAPWRAGPLCPGHGEGLAHGHGDVRLSFCQSQVSPVLALRAIGVGMEAYKGLLPTW